MTAADGSNAILTAVVERVLGDAATTPLLKVEEVARLLGQGRTATFDAVRRGDIPSVHIGRRVLVPTPALAAWLLQANGEAPAAITNGEGLGALDRGHDQGRAP